MPQALTIARGDSVEWVNKDAFPHTATSIAPGFDSKEIGAGSSWKLTPQGPAELPYVCTLHPTMTGTLRVE
jgi:plastocyanin